MDDCQADDHEQTRHAQQEHDLQNGDGEESSNIGKKEEEEEEEERGRRSKWEDGSCVGNGEEEEPEKMNGDMEASSLPSPQKQTGRSTGTKNNNNRHSSSSSSSSSSSLLQHSLKDQVVVSSSTTMTLAAKPPKKGARRASPKSNGNRRVEDHKSLASSLLKPDTQQNNNNNSSISGKSAASRVKSMASKEADALTQQPLPAAAAALHHSSSSSSSPFDAVNNKVQNDALKEEEQRWRSPPARKSSTMMINNGTAGNCTPEKDKASSLAGGAADLRIHPSPAGARTSPNKPTSRFVDLRKSSQQQHVPPSSPAASSARKTAADSPDRNSSSSGAAVQHNRRASLEGGGGGGDRMYASSSSKGKELLFLPRRNSIIGIGMGNRKSRDNESIASSEQTAGGSVRENADMGPFLLKLAKQAVTSGDNLYKALDYASRAARSFEEGGGGGRSVELVMSLHILAAIHCTLGQFEEAIPVLKHSIRVAEMQGEGGGQDDALAAFAGNMQLGDTYGLLGRGEDALAAYNAGLEVQKRALGEQDPRVGETCRYVAEAHTQALQFEKAEELCQHALDIHKEHSAPASIEEATDRRLMGLICNAQGRFEAALEHLVLASMALIANGKDVDVAAVDVTIGDAYVSLGRYDEAVFAYQKALTVFKSSEGENHVSVASVYVSLAEAYLKIGKIRESRTYCDSALRIYTKQQQQQQQGNQLNEVATGLTDLAVVYEALSEQEQALSLLKKALAILESVPGQHSTIAGVEAQIGVLSYMRANYVDARTSFSKAIRMLRGSAEKKTALFGIVLNQMGLCCLHLSDIGMAVKSFEESREVLETVCGPHHPDTLSVYSNLAAAYDASGRLDDAINALQYVVEVREEELGTAEPEVEDERNRLAELLKEAGRLRARRLNNTLGLLMQPKTNSPVYRIPAHNASSVSVPVIV